MAFSLARGSLLTRYELAFAPSHSPPAAAAAPQVAKTPFSIVSGDSPATPAPPAPPAGCKPVTAVTDNTTKTWIWNLAVANNASVAQVLIDNGLDHVFDLPFGGKFYPWAGATPPSVPVGTTIKINTCQPGTWSKPYGAWNSGQDWNVGSGRLARGRLFVVSSMARQLRRNRVALARTERRGPNTIRQSSFPPVPARPPLPTCCSACDIAPHSRTEPRPPCLTLSVAGPQGCPLRRLLPAGRLCRSDLRAPLLDVSAPAVTTSEP